MTPLTVRPDPPDEPPTDETADSQFQTTESATEVPVPLDAAFEVPIEDAIEQQQAAPHDEDAWAHE